MANPGRLPAGLSTRAKTDACGMYGLPDPTAWHTYWNDFDSVACSPLTGSSAEWTITLVGSGTNVISAADGGVLLSTTSAGGSDQNSVQLVYATFLPTAGKKMIFKARWKVDALACGFQIGMVNTDTTQYATSHPTDGIYFIKPASAGATLSVYCRKDATTGSTSKTGLGAVVAATYTETAFYYDGISEVSFYQDAVKIWSLTATSTYLPDALLAPSYSILNDTTAARAASIDYILVANER